MFLWFSGSSAKRILAQRRHPHAGGDPELALPAQAGIQTGDLASRLRRNNKLPQFSILPHHRSFHCEQEFWADQSTQDWIFAEAPVSGWYKSGMSRGKYWSWPDFQDHGKLQFPLRLNGNSQDVESLELEIDAAVAGADAGRLRASPRHDQFLPFGCAREG